jgi:hypothetical protein
MSGYRQNIDKLPQTNGSDYNYLYAYNVSDQVEYIMISWPWNKNKNRKTIKDDPVWQITRYTYSGVFVTEIAHANGDSNFVHQASKYLEYDYDIN